MGWVSQLMGWVGLGLTKWTNGQLWAFQPTSLHSSYTPDSAFADHYKLHLLAYSLFAFSALTLLVGRQEGHPARKNFEWCSTGMVICLERDADLHMAQLMPLPLTVSCFNKTQIGFTFLVPAYPGSPGKGAVKRVCVCVCLLTVCVYFC